MQTLQSVWRPGTGWTGGLADANLVLVFGGRHVLERPGAWEAIRKAYPKAVLAGASTAGEIAGTRVLDDTVVATAVRLEHGSCKAAEITIAAGEGSEAAGIRVVRGLPSEGLVHVLVFSDGSNVNGSELVRGMTSALPRDVVVTGGFAADGSRFEKTLVVGPGGVGEHRIVAVGLYGQHLKVGFGSLGGWDAFGVERRVTRSKGNVLYELDGRPALGLYKAYLGDHASGLPATGLLFPLTIRPSEGGPALTRTILSVGEKDQSLTFAGDIPQGSVARLMKANFDRLVDGAQGAAQRSEASLKGMQAELAILISCVGRRLVLTQRIEEELEAVADVLGSQATLCGFYSYGEICPSAPEAGCELHNQTMTITTLRED